MNLTVVPFGNAIGPFKVGPTWECQHGANECTGNRWEQCAIAHYPHVSDHFPFYSCMEACGGECAEQGAFDKLAKKCAKSSNLNFTTLSTCIHGPESDRLMQKFHDLTPANHQYTPWVLVNNKLVSDLDSFVKVVCDAYAGAKKPAGCKGEDGVPTSVVMA